MKAPCDVFFISLLQTEVQRQVSAQINLLSSHCKNWPHGIGETGVVNTNEEKRVSSMQRVETSHNLSVQLFGEKITKSK